jgi:hypothetical protein
MPQIHRSSSQPQLTSMKIRRTNSASKSYSRNLSSYGVAYDRHREGSFISNRVRVASFYLTVFISGCLVTGFLLSISPQHSLQQSMERSQTSRLMLQHPAVMHRKALHTAGAGGKISICRTVFLQYPDQTVKGLGFSTNMQSTSRAPLDSWLHDESSCSAFDEGRALVCHKVCFACVSTRLHDCG